ncbi:Dicer-like protein 1 [Neonectria ditissima]|uniref:Dicer-like protein 1 n=1 Tax=Neonectria ditissima TaxID=78410 RepID=A0A0P7B7M8_9HYPO|nr:Dicer-like protein 1 [Neonectria ditissima]
MDLDDLISFSLPAQMTTAATSPSSPAYPLSAVESSLDDKQPASNSQRATPPPSVDCPIDEPEDIDSDDDDAYRLNVNPERTRKVTEKKRIDTAAFQSWIANNQREVTKDSKRSPRDLAYQSVAHLVKESEDRKIIATPREYQVELFERAKTKNTIVVLDTGSGKTLIAALLLRHTLEQELEDRAIGKQKKVAFFLVEKVALCFQQYAVLNCNLEHPITKFFGDMTGIMKTKEFWDTQFDENMVVVCTAQILLDCLDNGFIRMTQINLLIFDEAHHTKKNHPYARIIKSHYIRETKERPRIMGMTASPVDCRTKDVKVAAAELESMLCSEIATISDEVMMDADAQRQKVVETKETYERLEFPEDSTTELWRQISQHVSHNTQFRALLEFTKEASSTLGRWCADRYWKLLTTDGEMTRLTARTDRDFALDFASTQAERATDAIRTVQQLIEDYEPRAAEPGSADLSSKAKLLYSILREAFSDYGTSRCIVFVEKRYTACLLADLFKQSGMRIPGMTVSYMVGCQSTTSNLGNMSFRDQVLALQRFKRGETNCLFATPVAEEGIDIPQCDLVIRFDLYNSVIQYLQSKGRARQENSRYISMAEEGNMKHLRGLYQATRDASALRRFCSALPADRKLLDQSIDATAAAQFEQAGQKVYEVPSTGARLTYPHSLDVLARFVSSLSQAETSLKPEFIVTTFGPKFIADVILPDSSPIKSMSGFPQRSKMLARCSAAFEVCVELIQKTYINEHFQPVFVKKLPAMRNARLAVSSNKKADYRMLLKPKIWSEVGTETPSELFVTAIALESPNALGRHSRPLLLLSRQKIPQVPNIPLFFGNGSSSLVKLTTSDEPIGVTEIDVKGLAKFTLKVFADIFSKEYDADPVEIPYFLAPCVEDHGQVLQEGQAHIDWDVVRTVRENEKLAWENAPDEFFYNKFVTDPHDGSRKLVINGINKSLRPSDPTPANVPEHKGRAYRAVEQTIKQYSNSLWLRARQKAKWRDDQPVVSAEVLSLRRNLLDEFQVDEDINNECFVILEALHVSPLPMDVVTMAMTFPAIIHRIDSVLICLDACSLLNLSIKPSLALEALTKDSDNTGDHDEEDINFQAGMGNNYERLEFLGDTFLKMATTIALFTLIPDSNEFEYHVERMLLICNQNLFNHAVDRKLQEYVRSKALDRRTWYPALKLKKGKAPKTELRHNLADKSIADVCEALIGAAYVTTQDGDFDMAVRAVTQMVKSKNHQMQSFGDYYAAYKVPPWQTGHSTAAHRFVVSQVAKATGYEFSSASLLRSAFKHPSYPYEPIPNYQRLEFLGDALLDMSIVDYLFKRYPVADPQWLTEHKMAMASNQFLGCVCVQLKLHKHLLITTAASIGQISEYVAELEQAEAEAREEAARDGTPMRCNFWLGASQPPKALPDIVEAFIGAMFVDARYDYGVVVAFFARFVQPYFEDMALYDTFAKRHPVTFLARKMQSELMCTQWRICTSNVPCALDEGVRAMTESDVVCALMIHGDVFAHATAKSGRYAKIAVAKRALEKLKELGDAAKATMGCDCKVTEPMQPDSGDDDAQPYGTAI